MYMENRRRNKDDRRQNEASENQPPYMTKDGVVYTDRRKSDRRRIDVLSLIEMGEVEEIEITAV